MDWDIPTKTKLKRMIRAHTDQQQLYTDNRGRVYLEVLGDSIPEHDELRWLTSQEVTKSPNTYFFFYALPNPETDHPDNTLDGAGYGRGIHLFSENKLVPEEVRNDPTVKVFGEIRLLALPHRSRTRSNTGFVVMALHFQSQEDR